MLSTNLSVVEVPKYRVMQLGFPEFAWKKLRIQPAEYEVYIEFGEEFIV